MKKLIKSAILGLAITTMVSGGATVFAASLNESEPNDSMATADKTYSDYDNLGKISTAGESDYYSIIFDSNGKANFWLGNIPSGCNYDLYLYDSNGNLLTSSTNSGNASELISGYQITQHKTYYMRVKGVSGTSSSNYTVRGKNISTVFTPLTGEAQRMECGEKVIWDKCTSSLITAKSKFESLVKAKGWSISYSSAYRPDDYQKHLREVWDYKKNKYGTLTSEQKAVVDSEWNEHGIIAQPATTSNHASGKAFDANVYDASGKALNSKDWINSDLLKMAGTAGLSNLASSGDGVHFYVN